MTFAVANGAVAGTARTRETVGLLLASFAVLVVACVVRCAAMGSVTGDTDDTVAGFSAVAHGRLVRTGGGTGTGIVCLIIAAPQSASRTDTHEA